MNKMCAVTFMLFAGDGGCALHFISDQVQNSKSRLKRFSFFVLLLFNKIISSRFTLRSKIVAHHGNEETPPKWEKRINMESPRKSLLRYVQRIKPQERYDYSKWKAIFRGN